MKEMKVVGQCRTPKCPVILQPHHSLLYDGKCVRCTLHSEMPLLTKEEYDAMMRKAFDNYEGAHWRTH